MSNYLFGLEWSSSKRELSSSNGSVDGARQAIAIPNLLPSSTSHTATLGHALMSGQRIQVAYASNSLYQASESWKHVLAALRDQLPLRNLHWRRANVLRTIQELDVNFVSLETVREDRGTSQIPITLLEKPLLNLYFVPCEDADVYKNTIKKQIKDWHSSAVLRKHQEWLIVQIVRPDARTAHGGFFQMKGSVLDRLKSDFNSDKRDRVVQLPWEPGQSNPAAWAEIITKVKEGILLSFDSAVTQREEEVKRSESQRQMPGWNFCTFFILKESLAASFEGACLFDDALVQYDELEMSFFEVLREKNLSWFGKLIDPGPKDDSSRLLSINKKAYRTLILSNNISVFDFRVYLLARQCALLGQLGRITEITRKSGSFLGAFGRRLREVKSILANFFVESWIYSSALSTVDQCDGWAAMFELEDVALISLNAGKGELVELARNQLDILGIECGHLPPTAPFTMAVPTSSTSVEDTSGPEASSKAEISNTDLLNAIGDQEAFYKLYISVTKRAIDFYVDAGRRKFALKLHSSLAALDIHRAQLVPALQIYTSLPAHYAPNSWTSLESYMLSLAIDTHAGLAKEHDVEWVYIVLAFLKAYVDDLGQELLIHDKEKVSYVTKLVSQLITALDGLSTDVIQSEYSAFSIRVTGMARLAGTEDGSYLDVCVFNRLPCAISAKEVNVTVMGRGKQCLKYNCDVQSIPVGTSHHTLFCPTSSFGVFVLDTSEIVSSRLKFRWTHRKAFGGSRTAQNVSATTLIRLPKDRYAFTAQIGRPQRIQLDGPPQFSIDLFAGRNHIRQATVRFSGPPSAQFAYQNASIHGTNDYDCENDCIILRNIEADSRVSILIQYTHSQKLRSIQVGTEVEYFSRDHSNHARLFRSAQIIETNLPVFVNVEDFFRGSQLISKFTISSAETAVRINSAHLQSENEGVQISGCKFSSDPAYIVTPAVPASFIFSINFAAGRVKQVLRLLIKYRMVSDELEALLNHAVDLVINDAKQWNVHRDSLIEALLHAYNNDSSWILRYENTGELIVPDLRYDPTEFKQEVFQKLREIRGQVKNEAAWHEFEIPVEIPMMDIVASASLKLIRSSGTMSTGELPPLYAGQPISATISVVTSFQWSGHAELDTRKYLLRFDVEEMLNDWLVSGRKRGDFWATNGSRHEANITLVALHHGVVTLPKIAINSHPVITEEGQEILPTVDTHHIHGAEKVMVLPRGGRSTFVVPMGES